MTKRMPSHRIEEIPQFASEQEEREWWDHHDFGDEFLDGARPTPCISVTQVLHSNAGKFNEVSPGRECISDDTRYWLPQAAPRSADAGSRVSAGVRACPGGD